MNESKMKTAIGMSVIALTRHLMDKHNLTHEEAYKKLLETELYKLLNDGDTRLYLEENSYLCEACDLELDRGMDVLYEFINQP